MSHVLMSLSIIEWPDSAHFCDSLKDSAVDKGQVQTIAGTRPSCGYIALIFVFVFFFSLSQHTVTLFWLSPLLREPVAVVMTAPL